MESKKSQTSVLGSVLEQNLIQKHVIKRVSKILVHLISCLPPTHTHTPNLWTTDSQEEQAFSVLHEFPGKWWKIIWQSFNLGLLNMQIKFICTKHYRHQICSISPLILIAIVSIFMRLCKASAWLTAFHL